MTTINPVTTQEPQQATAFKGKGSAKKVAEALSKKDIIPLKVIDTVNSPFNRAGMEGRSKEELKEIAVRDALELYNLKLTGNLIDDLAKKAAKDGYKAQ